MTRTPVADGDEITPQDNILVLHLDDAATVETRQSAGSDFSPVSGQEVNSGDRVDGAFPAGAFILDPLPNGTPSLRVSGAKGVLVGLN